MQTIRALASESSVTVKAEEDKVKLGGSDLKVTKLGIGAWSWGDTSYWNNFEWDGEFHRVLRFLLLVVVSFASIFLWDC